MDASKIALFPRCRRHRFLLLGNRSCIALISYIHVTMQNRHTVHPVHIDRAQSLMYLLIHCGSARGTSLSSLKNR